MVTSHNTSREARRFTGFLQSTSNPKEYLDLYRSNGKELRRLRGDLGEKDHASVSITFSLALAKVEAESVAAADLLRLCAFLSPDAIPEENFSAAADYIGESLKAACVCPLTLVATIRAATRFALLRRDPARKTLGIHRLVQQVIRDGMDDGTQKEWAKRAVAATFIGFTSSTETDGEVYERQVSNAVACIDNINKFEFDFCMVWKLKAEAGVALSMAGDYERSEILLRQAVTPAEDLALYYLLAKACFFQGKYGEAEAQIMHGLEVTDPESHQDCGCRPRSLDLLAEAMVKQGRYCEADVLAENALQKCEARLGPNQPGTTHYLINLAELRASRLCQIYNEHGYIDYG